MSLHCVSGGPNKSGNNDCHVQASGRCTNLPTTPASRNEIACRPSVSQAVPKRGPSPVELLVLPHCNWGAHLLQEGDDLLVGVLGGGAAAGERRINAAEVGAVLALQLVLERLALAPREHALYQREVRAKQPQRLRTQMAALSALAPHVDREDSHGMLQEQQEILHMKGPLSMKGLLRSTCCTPIVLSTFGRATTNHKQCCAVATWCFTAYEQKRVMMEKHKRKCPANFMCARSHLVEQLGVLSAPPLIVHAPGVRQVVQLL